MIVSNDLPLPQNTSNIAKMYIAKYQAAKTLRENFIPLFEECYEYALPQRESLCRGYWSKA
jgi:hypothetical protein